ncbi:hypothetical protein BBW65_06210 [Helicobacter enhydrae]|uniref:Chorismate dehydratase n=1 Tax=Helicobacter enhydrae TaxID=222136 RepID=A0A1B1U6U6_9HELI|nr:MqnA/MqnD/SBP family protein [Helicobacter enhydrae]ANV98412.1 hypothetical protein BBW65_06210 [Helicobacter enhydrae]
MYGIGKIDYLNLLPFEIYIKGSALPSQLKAMMKYKKSYPAKLNQDLLFHRIDMGFVSSILANRGKRNFQDIGIVAKGEVWSVLALPNDSKKDAQSATSNALIDVLGESGEVLIGDRALLYKLEGGECKDLGLLWWNKKRLPFVFGLFCVARGSALAEKIARGFGGKAIKIPYYLLKQYAYQSQIPYKQILQYLQRISYTLGAKEKMGLNNFHREMMFLQIKKPKRNYKEALCKK